MKTMAWLKRAITVLISAVLIASTGLYAYAETDQDLEAATLGDQYDATNMWLSDLEGSVRLIEDGVPPMKPEKNMRMKSGQALETEEGSLAILDLDRERLAIMDEISLASFEETHHGDRISISLTKGAMYFRVGIPLQDD
jgi:NADH:ubiquinone oxidoreductase subunit D